MVTRAQSRAAWRKWYKSHKEELNRERREKYKTDENYRIALLAQQRVSRAESPRPTSKPSDGRIFKNVGKKSVEVLRIGSVAARIDRDVQSIRIWEREGRIPAPSVPGAHRYYTLRQVNLLHEFAELMTEVRYEHPKVRAEKIEKKSQEIHAKWKLI